MKKIFYMMLIALLAVSFAACSDDDDNGGGDNNNGKVKLTAVFRYKKDGVENPSLGTKMYIFKNTADFDNGWEYDATAHTFKLKSGAVVQPIYTFRVNDNGVIEEMIADKTSYIYAYEPGIDPTKFGVDKFKTEGDPVSILKVH